MIYKFIYFVKFPRKTNNYNYNYISNINLFIIISDVWKIILKNNANNTIIRSL
jgi:hypothetical protein